MGVLGFFYKKIMINRLKKISNVELVPYLTKDVLDTFLNHFEIFVTVLDAGKLDYFIEPSMAYYDADSKFVYGYILLCKEYGTYEEDLMWELNLVKINLNNEAIQVLFSISIDEETKELKAPIFFKEEIENIDGGLDKCIQIIKNYAYFNGYKTLPPYVFFSTLIKPPKK